MIIQRLHAEAVAREKERAFLPIPKREGPHAVETREARLAPLGVSGEDDFGVAFGTKAIAHRLELPLQLEEIINLAVEREPIAEGRERRVFAAVRAKSGEISTE